MSKRLFKTMVAVLAIAAAATGPVRAQSTTESFTITFKTTGSGSDGASPQTTIGGIIANGADYVSEVNATKVYQAKDGFGIKLGSNSATGSLTLTLANEVENVTSIVVNARQYGDGTSERTLQIQGDNYTTTDAFADYTYTYTTPATVSTITLATTTKRAYIKSVTVNYTTSTGGGGSTPEPEPEPAVPHSVRFAEGMSGWQVQDVTASASATAPAVLQNVMAGDSLVVTAPATLPGKVKSVKAVKYVAPAATVTSEPTATGAIIEVGSTAALVNAGAASGGTMMYAVTTTNAQPASTADFSASIPTAEGRSAGTYYVWFYAMADADHSDSEIAGSVSVTLAVITTVTWSSSNISDLNVYGTYDSYTKEGITLSANADMNNAEWRDYGDESMNGISFQANQSGGYTFTAPTGKQFTKIEMTLTNSGGWDIASPGTGWAFGVDYVNNIYKVTWTGSAASTVGLLTGVDHFAGEQVKSIVFTLN